MISQVEIDFWNDINREALYFNPVARNITYHRFVSKSKGIRNGKKRVRQRWKEIRLIKYRIGFHQWHNFKFDEYCTEILGPKAETEDLKEEIIKLWGW